MHRVLLISSQPFFPWRGHCLRANHELLALAQLGYAVDFLTVPLGQPPPIPGVRLLQTPNPLGARALPEGPSLRKLGFDLLLLGWGLALAWSNRYAVVQGMADAGGVAWLVGRASDAAVILEKREAVTPRRGMFWRRALARLGARFENFLARRVDVVISANPPPPAAGEGGGRACHIPDIPATLEPPPRAHVAACRQRLRRKVDDILVAYVGSRDACDGLDMLLAAVARARRADERLRLLVIGGSAREIARRERALERRGLSGVATFLGRVAPTDLAAILASADILAAPRLCDGPAPMRALDYLQAGVAIVAADSPAHRAVFTPDAALFAPPDADAFAVALLKLCADPPRRHAMGREGRELAARFHRFEQFQDALRRCYAYALTTRQGRLGKQNAPR